jgi:uncharacterized membrane protein
MNIRSTIYALADKYDLSSQAVLELFSMANLGLEPANLYQNIWRGVSILATALGGFGLVLWVAANWDSLSRVMQFGLLQGFVVVMCLGAWYKPSIAKPLSLLAMIAIGALFAYFGQTYQTGADTWQLFTLWAVLALPLCFAMRSDVLWIPWLIVFFTAINLWANSLSQHWQYAVYFIDWVFLFAGVVMVSPLFRSLTGAGIWAFRFALLGMIVTVIPDSIGKFDAAFYIGLLLLVFATVYFSRLTSFDLYALSMVTLALNVLLLSQAISQISWRENAFYVLILLGFIAILMLTMSVKWVIKLDGRYQRGGYDA